MRLFAKQLLYEAKRELPEFSLVSGEGVGEEEEAMTDRHEKEYRVLVEKQQEEGEEEKRKAEVMPSPAACGTCRQCLASQYPTRTQSSHHFTPPPGVGWGDPFTPILRAFRYAAHPTIQILAPKPSLAKRCRAPHNPNPTP